MNKYILIMKRQLPFLWRIGVVCFLSHVNRLPMKHCCRLILQTLCCGLKGNHPLSAMKLSFHPRMSAYPLQLSNLLQAKCLQPICLCFLAFHKRNSHSSVLTKKRNSHSSVTLTAHWLETRISYSLRLLEGQSTK